LFPVTTKAKPIKVILLQRERNRDRVLGGTQLTFDKFVSQKRLDNWFDLGGCGQVRLAIRFVHSKVLFYRQMLKAVDSELKQLRMTLATAGIDSEIAAME
jgi:hypothetical protein